MYALGEYKAFVLHSKVFRQDFGPNALMHMMSPITQGRGMTESVRYQWVFIMHQQAAIHDATPALTSKCRNTSKQHKDIGTTRSKQDGRDYFKYGVGSIPTNQLQEMHDAVSQARLAQEQDPTDANVENHNKARAEFIRHKLHQTRTALHENTHLSVWKWTLQNSGDSPICLRR